MITAGIDIGSRSIELVRVKNGEIIDFRQGETGFDPISNVKKILEGVSYDQIMATGYGRNLFEITYNAPTVTEIKAYAVGAKALKNDVETILDIGGQDSKAISLFENGKIRKFEMNDRCAAGTGKFLEIMAKTLGYSLEEFGPKALGAEKDLHINSMCTVFAESEVTSLVAKGERPDAIAKGLHLSVVRRASSMLKRININKTLFFAGGVANNSCITELLAEALKCNIFTPENPQMVGAFGAALLAVE